MTTAMDLKKEISSTLGGRGFKKSSGDWHLDLDDFVLVVNLQKSQYGDQFYVNFGVAAKELIEKIPPKEHKCDVRFRLSSVVPVSEQDKIDEILDLDVETMTEKERLEEFSRLFASYGLNLLMEFSSRSRAREVIASNTLPAGVLVSLRIKELLGSSKE